MFKELEMVELTEEVTGVCIYGTRPEAVTLPKGRRGAVIVAFSVPSEGYDVEFVEESGDTLAILTLKPGQLRAAI